MFMGALLLLAAVLTWGIGLMMSPHGETVAEGTEYLRGTIVTFKRNGAIGTLVLSVVAAWLLFPRRRPRWPARDWALTVVLVFLAGSSLYTLIWLRPAAPGASMPDENLAAMDMNGSSNGSAAVSEATAATINAAQAPAPQFPVDHAMSTAVIDGAHEQSADDNTIEQQSDADTNEYSSGGEPTNNEGDGNQE
jgi:hypothetical protein